MRFVPTACGVSMAKLPEATTPAEAPALMAANAQTMAPEWPARGRLVQNHLPIVERDPVPLQLTVRAECSQSFHASCSSLPHKY
jgi:hypothetical protein